MLRATHRRSRLHRALRSRVTLLTVLAVIVPSLVYAAAPTVAAAAGTGFSNGHPVTPNDLSACGTKPARTLCVRAAENSILPGKQAGGQGPDKNDPVPTFKWLLNKDNTGGVTLGTDGKPIASEIAKCYAKTSTNTGGNPNYPNPVNPADGTGPLLADGSPNPAACNWPSIHSITSSPVVADGDQSQWGTGTTLPLYNAATKRGLPAGKYLVSVTANGFQIAGAHFTVAANGSFSGLDVSASGAVVVSMNPLPIPLVNVRLKVYGDMAATNSQWDEQSEFGLPGYDAHLTDYDGPVNVDYYNNPLCTAYQTTLPYDRAKHPDPTDSYYQIKMGLDGRPLVDPDHHIRGNFLVSGPSTGRCTSDSNGDLLIPNMAPNRYGSSVIADTLGGTDPATGSYIPAQQTCGVLGTTSDSITTTATQSQACWVQTTTLEGNHDFDTWPQASSTGYDTELLVGGELVPQVQFGFVRAGCMADPRTGTVDFNGLTSARQWLSPSDPRCASGPYTPRSRRNPAPTPTGSITGKILGAAAYYPGIGGLTGINGQANNSGTAGYKFDRPVHHPWVTLSDLNNGDKTIWASNANLDGSFSIKGVPDGSYSVAVWDQMQDYIFDSFNVTVSGGKETALGVVPLLEWWTRITGKICVDANGNGRCDPGEAGVPKFTLQNLDRTNNAQEGGQNTDVTDDHGNYEFTEAYPLGYADIIQAFNTRFKTIGVTWQACNDPHEHTTLTAAVDVSYNPVIAQCGRLDWAVQPYTGATTTQNDPNKPVSRADNGGIVATVLYDAVRNRYLGRAQPAYDYFSGIPGVMTELFQPVKAPASATGSTQTCGGAQLPAVSFTGYYLNCDGSYRTTGPDGGYKTTYVNGAITATDRFGGLTPNDGTVNAYNSEHYGRATGCVARDANGNIISGTRQKDGTVLGTQANGVTVTDFLPGLQTDPTSSNPGHYTQACIEAPATAVNFGLGSDNLALDPNNASSDIHGSQTVDGNFALTPTDAQGNPAVGDFLAKVDVPGDTVLNQVNGADLPLYKVANEASMNNFAGANLAPYSNDLADHSSTPEFVPQNADLNEVFNSNGSSHRVTAKCGGSTCPAFSFPPQAGPAAQMAPAVPVTGSDSPTTMVEDPNTASPSPDPQCAGAAYTVNVTDPGFLSAGGSPLQGISRNSCDVHLIHVGGGQSVAPNFYLYTDVPIPTTFIVQNFDDTNLSTNKFETQYGDAAPIPNSPEGVYDWQGNLAYQMNIDPNGIAEALMPSTDVADCATPAGICQNIYRFVGNDPGTIDHPNFNYDPNFQTITANFQALPGVFTPADTAPTRSALAFLNGGQKFSAAAQCGLLPTQPQLFSIDHPYVDLRPGQSPLRYAGNKAVIRGLGFGTTKGSVTLNGIALPSSAVNWVSDSEIDLTIPTNTLGNKYNLAITTSSGVSTLNGINFYVLTNAFQPQILEVDPTFTAEATNTAGWRSQRRFPSIQEALERAAGYWLQPSNGSLTYTQERPNDQLPNAVVVVYPGANTLQSPVNSAQSSGVWFEPIIVHSAVNLQGVGPGGVIPATATQPATNVAGTVLDGRYYFSLTDTTTAPPAQIDWSTAPQDTRAQHAVDVWQTIAGALWPKTPNPDNKLITEGQDVTVLAQTDQPAYSSDTHPSVDGMGIQAAITINTPTNVNANTGQRTGPAGGADATQGGAIFLNGHDDWTQFTDNKIDGNSGSYGAIRIGSPQLDGQHNWNVEFGRNQIVANGGNNLGGGMAIFNDAGGYNIHNNLICGNQSAEYGGGMSQYGLSVAPVNVAGTLATTGGRRPSTTFTAATGAPFGNAVNGESLAGFGQANASIATISADKRSITITGVSGAGSSGTFSYLPSNPSTPGSPANLITANTVKFNQSQDEGGGIMIAGQLPQNSTQASQGAGAVTISGNVLAVNAANDDGGGLRFLQAGNFPMRVENNQITNNISSHEGGGIALDDTAQVTIINDTIAKNITTATAVTSDGSPAPAGISTADNSAPFQATLPMGSKAWSDPIIANDVIYDNRAGSWNAGTSNVAGIGQVGDSTPINYWDVGVADPMLTSEKLSPVYTVIDPAYNSAEGYNASTTNTVLTGTQLPVNGAVNNAPGFTKPFDLTLDIAPMRINFRFRVTAIVNIDLPSGGTGDYHVTVNPTHSLAYRAGSNQPVAQPMPAPFTTTLGLYAPKTDLDGLVRYSSTATRTAIDSGAYRVAP